ncbi:MAG: SMP-30/gluconolactonase/LRE family protein [Proteobacteria bacterium]|nr:SMP-30/gluconolactonase/LRE family protein [Pseudomonadota bacterium]
MRKVALALGWLLAFPVGAETAGSELIQDCEAVGAARPVCAFRNPEDLAPLPDGHSVVVSEYGRMAGDRAGALAVFDLRSDARLDLYRGGAPGERAEGWGDAACPGPPTAEFSPHGIDLAERPDGQLQLAVVQHGGRESIEFFALESDAGVWKATWRGCVVAPGYAWLNEVVLLPDGGVLTTHMRPRTASMQDLTESYEQQKPDGHVLEWQPGQGFSKLAGSDTAVPNGIEVSADGETVFLNASGVGEVWRLGRRTGEIEARASVKSTDNSTWAPDGRLLVASSRAETADYEICMKLESGSCPLAFAIVAVDPETLAVEEIYSNQGPPMGAGTVGLQVGDELLVGTFAGDRILRVALGEGSSGDRGE